MSHVTKVPKKINVHIRQLCSQISPHEDPVHIKVIQNENSDFLDCFINVRTKVENEGGEIVYGWAIWEWPYIMVEAEFHSIWKNPAGQLVDITPNFLSSRRIFFLKDSSRKYQFIDGERYDNIRLAINGHEYVKKFIDISHTTYELEEKYSHGREIRLFGNAVVQYQQLKTEKLGLYELIKTEIAPKPRKRGLRR